MVWDIASGAKHFVLKEYHQSVSSTTRQGSYFADGHWASGHFAKGYFGGATLIIDLSGDAANALGPSITALGLAEQVHGYWSAASAEWDSTPVPRSTSAITRRVRPHSDKPR